MLCKHIRECFVSRWWCFQIRIARAYMQDFSICQIDILEVLSARKRRYITLGLKRIKIEIPPGYEPGFRDAPSPAFTRNTLVYFEKLCCAIRLAQVAVNTRRGTLVGFIRK